MSRAIAAAIGVLLVGVLAGAVYVTVQLATRHGAWVVVAGVIVALIVLAVRADRRSRR